MKRSTLAIRLVIAAVTVTALAVGGGAARAEVYSTDFEQGEGFTPGGINLQPGSGTLWWENSANLGSGDIDQEIQNTYAHSGSQAYRISNAKGDQGSVLMTGVQLFDVAGETGASTVGSIGTTGFGPAYNQHGENNSTPVPTTATKNKAEVSYWWRTVSTAANPDFGFSAAQTDLAGRRMSYIAYYADGDDADNLKAQVCGTEYNTTADDWAWSNETSPALQWGEWYHTTEEVIFNDGTAQDAVTFTVREDDGAGNPGAIVFQAQTYTWEAAYYLGDWAPAGTVQGIDTWALTAQNETDLAGQDGLGLVVDQFSMSTTSTDAPIPEPASLGLVGVGLLGLVRRRKRS